MDRFPVEVSEKINWYVYRLIDPRNGETFYVGKGKGDRVFQHVKGALASAEEEDILDLKFHRIKDISSAGLEVLHLIHRHGIKDPGTAYQIEAALMDAYPGLTNKAGGHGSGEFGCRHASQIVSFYSAEPFVPDEPLILISIGKSYDEDDKDIYDAVRGVWRISLQRAKSYKLVLAHRRGIVLGAFRPTRWLPALRLNFPWLDQDIASRIGFEGVPAEPSVSTHYIGKRVPEDYRQRGAANPIRFIKP